VNAVLSRILAFDRSIGHAVSKVRKKLGDTENDEHIQDSCVGVGYIFARPREIIARLPDREFLIT